MYFTREDKRLWHDAVHVVRAYEVEREMRAVFESEDPRRAIRDGAIDHFAIDGIERDSLKFDPTTINMLLARGYLERVDPDATIIRPTDRAYEAEFADRAIESIREVAGGLPHPTLDSLDALRDTAYADPDVLFLSGAVAPLVQEHWLALYDAGYAVTPGGKRSLQRAIVMFEF